MIKVDLNFEIKNLNNSKFGNAGEIIANHLVASRQGDPLKFYGWATALNKGDEVNLDESDFKKLREFVEQHEQLPILVKAPVLERLDELKDKSIKKAAAKS